MFAAQVKTLMCQQQSNAQWSLQKYHPIVSCSLFNIQQQVYGQLTIFLSTLAISLMIINFDHLAIFLAFKQVLNYD